MSNPALIRYLHTAPFDGVADSVLLSRYVASRDEAAFELLVRRHAEAVWKVCRGVLRQDADAEDAFQATFLTFATKAQTIRTACVAGWLHRVAVHTSIKLRDRMHRQSPTNSLDNVPAATTSPDVAVLHEELARLPDRYRLPVVLCELEGQTHAEAARTLGWPVGTVSGRLSRARARLRERLGRRGIGALTFGAISGPSAASLRVAVEFGVGTATPSVAIVSLSQSVVSAMQYSSIRVFVTAAVAVVGLAGTGMLAVLSQDRGPADPNQTRPAAPTAPGKPDAAWNKDDQVPSVFPNIKPITDNKDFMEFVEKRSPVILEGDPPLRKLQKAKLRTALDALKMDFNIVLDGAIGTTPDQAVGFLDHMDWSIRETIAAGLELAVEPEDRRAWLAFGVGIQKGMESIIFARGKVGAVRMQSALSVQQSRLDAEIALLKHDQKK